MLRLFGRWHQLVKMRAKSQRGPLPSTARLYATTTFVQAQRFCDWLDQHHCDLSRLPQTALDRYYRRLTPGLKHNLRPFLNWATAGGHMPRLAYSPTTVPGR